MKKIKLPGFVLRRKKLFAILLAGVLLAGGTTVYFVSKSKAAAANAGSVSDSPTRTVPLEKTTLYNSVNASGIVESAEVSNVATALTYKVKTVSVKVGDIVKKGDVIATLDTTDLEKEIATEKTKVGENVQKAKEAFTKDSAAYDEAVKWRDLTIQNRDKKYAARDAAKKAFDEVAAKITTFQAEYDKRVKEREAAVAALNAVNAPQQSAIAAVASAQAAYDTENARQQALIAAGTAPSQAEMDLLAGLKTALDNAITAKNNADAAISVQQTAYNAAEAAVTAAANSLKSAKDSVGYEAASAAYTAANAEVEPALNLYDTAEKSVKTAAEQRDASKKLLDQAGKSTELTALQEKRAKCTLVAETQGKVTTLKAVVGSPAGGTAGGEPLATIQDTSKLIVSITIPEYSIQKVKVGMQAFVTSDASKEKISGTLSRISPTANKSSDGAAGGFAADITITENTDKLFLGTKAKTEIILSSTENVYTVPIDAVGTDAKGGKIIYVQNEKGGFDEVPVTVGTENDFYIEVKGAALKEGMQVRAMANQAQTTPSTSEEVGGWL